VEDRAKDAERKEEVLGPDARVDVEREEEARVAERHRGEAVDAELGLELAVDRRVEEVRDDDPFLLGSHDRPVVRGDRTRRRRLARASEPALEDVEAFPPRVETAAEDAELAAEVPHHR